MSPKERSEELIKLFLHDGKQYPSSINDAKICATEIMQEYIDLKESDEKSTEYDRFIAYYAEIVKILES